MFILFRSPVFAFWGSFWYGGRLFFFLARFPRPPFPHRREPHCADQRGTHYVLLCIKPVYSAWPLPALLSKHLGRIIVSLGGVVARGRFICISSASGIIGDRELFHRLAFSDCSNDNLPSIILEFLSLSVLVTDAMDCDWPDVSILWDVSKSATPDIIVGKISDMIIFRNWLSIGGKGSV